VHTSAKARFISAAIWQISMSRAADLCPLTTFCSEESEKQSLHPDGDPDRQQNNLVHCPIANLPLKFHASPF